MYFVWAEMENWLGLLIKSLEVLSDNESRDINKLEVDWFIGSFIFALLENTSLHNGK